MTEDGSEGRQDGEEEEGVAREVSGEATSRTKSPHGLSGIKQAGMGLGVPLQVPLLRLDVLTQRYT